MAKSALRLLITLPDYERTHYFRQRQSQHAMNKDLEGIAVRWFNPASKKLAPTIQMANQDGRQTTVALSPLAVNGIWQPA